MEGIVLLKNFARYRSENNVILDYQNDYVRRSN